jgi:hypothetical protein
VQRERVHKLIAARTELAKNAPPVDFTASFDSLDIMEKVMRHFYLRALIEERMGSQTDWNSVDTLMLKALGAAEKVARYRHAQLSAIKLAGDINAKVTDNASLDELLAKIKGQRSSCPIPKRSCRSRRRRQTGQTQYNNYSPIPRSHGPLDLREAHARRCR